MIAGFDIHKQVMQAAVLEPASGEFCEERFSGADGLAAWVARWGGRVEVVAIEATTGWRWVARDLEAAGLEVRLVDAGQARALRGKKRKAKTDRLDARWLCLIVARGLLGECEAWLAPIEIQRLRDQTRLRKALADDRTRWEQLDSLETQLRRFARTDRRCRAVTQIFGVGPIIACHLVAEIGDATRFRRARQVVRLAGLDPVVEESADTRRRGHLAKAGSPTLRWALVQAAQHGGRQRSPERHLYHAVTRRSGSPQAKLTVARKIARRAYHVLQDLDRDQPQAA